MIIDVHVHSGEKHHFSEEMDVTLDKGLHVAGWEAKGLWKDTGIFDVGVDGLIERMDQAGVDKAFLFAMDLNYVWKSHVPNEYVAKIRRTIRCIMITKCSMTPSHIRCIKMYKFSILWKDSITLDSPLKIDLPF